MPSGCGGPISISISNLSYQHSNAELPALDDISLCLPSGSRTILVGANGAGKSTLLRILAGKKLITCPKADVRISGMDVFRESPPGITYLGTDWLMNPVVRGDIRVSVFLDSIGGYRHKARRDYLLDILDIDLDWHMHTISDGERRRVQLCMGLMTPWDVLLLDEVTVDLDVLVRNDLLRFLKNDTETRGSILLYATHIFDGLNDFPTHVAHIRFGKLVTPPTPWPFTPHDLSIDALLNSVSPLYSLALHWLKEDREYRRELENLDMKKTRGPKNQTVPSDSETFYKRYDYSH